MEDFGDYILMAVAAVAIVGIIALAVAVDIRFTAMYGG